MNKLWIMILALSVMPLMGQQTGAKPAPPAQHAIPVNPPSKPQTAILAPSTGGLKVFNSDSVLVGKCDSIKVKTVTGCTVATGHTLDELLTAIIETLTN